MKFKTKFGKAVYITVLSMVLLSVLVFAATPTQTFLSDTTSYFKGSLGVGTDSPTGIFEVRGSSGVLTWLDQNDNNRALYVDSEQTTNGAIDIYSDALTTGYGFLSYSNSVSYTGSGLIRAVIDNTGASGTGIKVTNDGTGHGLYVDQNGDGNGIYIETDASSTSKAGVYVVTGSTGDGIFIDQNANGNALRVDGEQTTDDGVQMDFDALTTGRGISLYSNSASYSGIGLMRTVLDNPSATGTASLITNDGTGNGLLIDQNGNGYALNIVSDATTKPGEYLYSNAIYTGTNNNAFHTVLVDNSAATGDVSTVRNDGTGNGLLIDQNGNGIALNIDNAGTQQALKITQNGDQQSLAVVNNGIYQSAVFQRTVAGGSYNVGVINDHASDTQVALQVQNDGTGSGLLIDQNGDGIALDIDSESNTQHLRVNAAATTMSTSNTPVVLFRNTGDMTTGEGVLSVVQDGAGSTSNAMNIFNDGTGNGLLIDQNGNGVGLSIDSEATTTNTVDIATITTGNNQIVKIDNAGTQSGASATALYVRQNSASTTARTAWIVNEGTGNALDITNEQTGNGLFIDQNGNREALRIDTEASDGTWTFRIDGQESSNGGFKYVSATTTKQTLVIGDYHLWVDSTGDLRITSGVPTSDTDGAVVGTQS